jgi:hypothetical protein
MPPALEFLSDLIVTAAAVVATAWTAYLMM